MTFFFLPWIDRVAKFEGNIAGKPTFGDDGLHILLRVQLKPNQTYSFVLTPMAFATPDGYPLANYRVEFKTK